MADPDTPSEGRPVLPFAGILFNGELSRSDVLPLLTDAWGSTVATSDTRDFEGENYYRQEMGTPLKRFWISPRDLWREGDLAEEKHRAIRIEKRAAETFSVADRPINVDPGYLKENQVVLASTKDADHRLFLGNGIWGEVTLLYEDGAFQPLPWTYPDYRSNEAKAFFHSLRSRFIDRNLHLNNPS